MDKAEYQEKLDQLKELVREGDHMHALEIVQVIDWRKVKNVRTLLMVADVYEANEMPGQSRQILQLALKRSSAGKVILTRIIELSLAMGDTASASEYYKDFAKLAPRDSQKYLLHYKILHAQGGPLEDQIDALKSYKDSEYDDRWAFELARLYAKAGMEEECVEECDDIILWFSEGLYVVKAMELKAKYRELTPSQQNKYDHRYDLMPELLVQEAAEARKRWTKAKQAGPKDEADLEADAEDEAAPELPREPMVDETMTNTMDLESRLSEGLAQLLGNLGRKPGKAAKEEPMKLSDMDEPLDMSGREATELEPEQAVPVGGRRESTIFRPGEVEAEAEEPAEEGEFDLSAVLSEAAQSMVKEARGEEASEAAAASEEEELPLIDISDILAEKEMDREAAEAEETSVASEGFVTEAEAVASEVSVAEVEAEAAEEPVAEAPTLDLAAAMARLGIKLGGAEAAAEEAVDAGDASVAELEAAAEEDSVAEPAADAADVADVEAVAGEDSVAEVKMAAPADAFSDDEEMIPVVDAAEVKAVAEAVAQEEALAEAEEAQAVADETPAEEPQEEAFDLASILAAEVSGIMSQPEQPEEKDLLTRLEEEADASIEHQEMSRETPQDKRYRMFRSDRPSKLTEEQKRIFTYFAKIPGMDEQIIEAMNQAYNGAVSKTSAHGNLAVMGRKGTGKTRLSEGLIKALCREFDMPAARFARISGEALNKKDIAKVVDKLSGGFLIIERASRMNDETIESLSQAMEFRTDSMIVIVEDEKDDLRSLMIQFPRFAEKFDMTINIPVFTNDELVTFARTYAGECGYKIDEMGILALYTVIGNNQRVDEPVSVAKVKDMVDAAIRKANRGGRKVSRRIIGKDTDNKNRVILYEKDFDI